MPNSSFYDNDIGHALVQRHNESKGISEMDKKETAELVKLARGKDFLEIGCGDGIYLQELLPIAKSVTGIDSSEFMLENAKKRLAGTSAKLFNQNAKSLSFEDESFDLVVCEMNTFGNFSEEEQIQGLKEMFRVLRPGGQIRVTLYNKEMLPHQIQHYKNIGATGISAGEDFITMDQGLKSERFTKERVEAILKKAGLEGKIDPFTELSLVCTIQK